MSRFERDQRRFELIEVLAHGKGLARLKLRAVHALQAGGKLERINDAAQRRWAATSPDFRSA
jgi:hypothetical protein